MKIQNIILKECGEFTARICEITPENARKLLEHNTHNRKISESRVNRYVDEIIRGGWVPTSSGIGFDEEGVLMDGQHRLAAIEKSGCSVRILVVKDLPVLAQEKVDRHMVRSLANVFQLSGLCDRRNIVQVATYIARRNHKWGSNASDEEVKEVLNIHRDSLYAVENATKQSAKKVNSAGVRTAMTIAHELYGDKAIDFYKKLQSELQERADHPAFRLRMSLMNLNNGTGCGKGYQDIVYGKTCYAFNAFIQGRKISSVLSADDIVKPE